METDQARRKTKVLIGKPGLDGHDRGAKVVALALRDAGLDVVYTGLHRTVEAIVATARDEAVDVIGLSIMSGAHVPICRKLVDLCRHEGLGDMRLVVGGVIPKGDVATLQSMGIHAVFPGGTSLDELVAWFQAVRPREGGLRGTRGG
jgi:methylmalonyl-CoA mutase C-terminal domain/subunit